MLCPLDWGLGHATRDVPIIKSLLHDGHKVTVAGSGKSAEFLKQEFPALEFVSLPGYRITYARKPFFLLWIFLQLPFFGFSIFREHRQLKKQVKKHQITQIISDNRYGLWHTNVKSVLITHQVFIVLPKLLKPLSGMLHAITRRLISKFDECWIPDYEPIEKSLSGKLAHGKILPKNAKYIGPLSRFHNFKTDYVAPQVPDVLVIISGPEPHRSLFEKEMDARFSDSEKSVLMLCGKPGNEISNYKTTNIQKVNHLPTEQLGFYMQNCKTIIARSGYSTIMDLHVLGRNAEWHPTQGQPEQEYLYEWMMRH